MGSAMGVRAVILVVLLVAPAAPVALAADAAVTEADALRLFLEGSPQARAVPLAAEAAGAAARAGTLLANPTVGYQVEDVAGVRDEYLTFQQAIPISGRRRVLREGSDAASAAARLAATRELQVDAHALRLAFSEVLYRQAALASLRRGLELLEDAVRSIRLREQEGESSGYDVLRAEQALAELRAETATQEAGLAEVRARFGSFFEPSLRMDQAALLGELATTSEPPALDAAIEEALARRADVMAVASQAAFRDAELRAARRQRVPEPTVAAGWKQTEALGVSDTGYIASVVLTLPLFDHGQIETARASAAQGRLEAEGEVLRRQVRAEVQAAVARERAAQQVLASVGPDGGRRAEELRRIAQLNYDEGETGILDLLDAHRAALQSELRSLAARYEARSAEIERQRAIGIEVTP